MNPSGPATFYRGVRVSVGDGLYVYCDDYDFVDPWAEREVVFLHHGLGRTARFWLPWIHPLSRNYRVLAVDVLGYGRSSIPGPDYPWGLERYAEHVINVLDALDIGRVHFVGESLGGCVALQLGAHHPGRVRSITLSAAPYKPAGGSDDLRELAAAIRGNGMSAWVDKILPDRMDWSRFPPAAYDWFRQELMKTPPVTISAQMLRQVHVDLGPVLEQIATPTLLLIPGDSPVRADEQMREMATRLRNAKAVEFPGERQWLYYSAAEKAVSEFASFVRSLE